MSSITSVPVPQSEPPTDFKIYKPSTLPSSQPVNLPDEYFNPTSVDLKNAQAILSARTQSLVNTPLQIRAAREADVKAKRDRWPETKIRVKFTDGTQLEKSFPSTNKIRTIYAFVRSCLRDDVKPIKFVLYQPPKRELKVSDLTVRDLTLAELQLAPSSLLLLKFEDDTLNHANVSAPLDSSVLSQAIDLPAPPPPAAVDTSAETRPTAPTASSSGSKEKKIGKWLKLGKK